MESISLIDYVPHELVVLLIGYLDSENLIIFTTSFQLVLTSRDYLFLLSNRFPEYYDIKINDYNIQFIYYALLYMNISNVSFDEVIRSLASRIQNKDTDFRLYELYKYLIRVKNVVIKNTLNYEYSP